MRRRQTLPRKVGYITPTEVAHYLRVERAVVYRWIRDGQLRAIPRPRHYTDERPRKKRPRHAILPEDFEKFLVRWRAGML